jgi:hypothetical protein
MRLAAQAIAAQPETGVNVVCGQPIVHPLDPDLAPQQVTLETPESADLLTIPVDRSHTEQPRIFIPQTHTSGFHTTSWDEGGAQARTQMFAANPEWNDARQARLTTAELPAFFGTLTPKVISVAPDAEEIATAGNELWRYLIYGVLGLLGLESGLACWVGRVR